MIEPLNFEQLSSEPFERIAEQFQELWSALAKHRSAIDAFLVSENPFKQSRLDRLAIRTAAAFTRSARTIAGEERAEALRRKALTKLFRGLVDYSYVILRSNRLWAPRYWEYPWAFLNTQPQSGMKILDAGSGWSLFPMYLGRLGVGVTATDLDNVQMNFVSPFLARLISAPIDYRVGNLVGLDLPDDTFDRVYCISVLEHLEEETIDGKPANFHKKGLDALAIRELIRVLRPGGLLAITVDWSENPHNLRSYRRADVMDRLLKDFRPFLVSESAREVDWASYWPMLMKLWQERFPFDTQKEAEGEAASALGILLQKPS